MPMGTTNDGTPAAAAPLRLLLACVGLALVSPAFAANCQDEIAALDVRLKTVSQAREGAAPATAPRSVPTPSPADTDAAGEAVQPVAPRDGVVQAKALLNRAHTLAQRRDETACLASISLARKQLDE
ncbi:hypothetical protein [uncultured Alsobacter sp.]|uniref:hypothetical protein n=1 Tax=uncultured Alsobacter sp. TaxID=1748258 RepID=UPI0025CE4D70|nr:hypothetical protein [uncultured Alsobacter sp.]